MLMQLDIVFHFQTEQLLVVEKKNAQFELMDSFLFRIHSDLSWLVAFHFSELLLSFCSP